MEQRSNLITLHATNCMMVAPILRGWDSLAADHHDSAKAGSSSEKAAAWRAARAEIATRLGESAIAFMGDIEKFFDTIDPTVLLGELAATIEKSCRDKEARERTLESGRPWLLRPRLRPSNRLSCKARLQGSWKDGMI